MVSWVLISFSLLLACMAAEALWNLWRGYRALRKLCPDAYREDDVLLKSSLVPPVSVIVTPTEFSEQTRAFVHRLLDLQFGSHEVVVVLEDPAPEALQTWMDEFRLERSDRVAAPVIPTAPVRSLYESRDPIRLVLVEKEWGGPADAFNAGVAVASSPVIGLVDPESEFEPTLLLRAVRPMLEQPNQTLAACAVAPGAGAGN